MKIYEEESEGMLKSKARLSFAAFYPKSFEKQNIPQALKIFHGKKYKHKVARHNKTETARFSELSLRMWSYLNIRSPKLNIVHDDKNRKPFSDPLDERSTYA